LNYTELTKCRLCSGTLTEILRLADTPIANSLAKSADERADYYPLSLAQCRGCMSVQMPTQIDPELLFPADYPYVSGTSPVFVRHLAEQVAAVSAQCELKRGDLVVEIGSNDGTLLRLLREGGYRAIGVDPATNLARKATGDGLLTFAAPFDEKVGASIASDVGQAKVVISNNALAHVEDLINIFRGVSTVLEPGGKLVFEVGYLPDVVATNNFPVVYHEHTFAHSLWPLYWALARCNLLMYHAHRIPTQGGSVRVYAERATSKVVERTDALNAMLEEEKALPAMLKAWPARIDAATTKLYSMLRSFKAQGKAIAGYGAAAKATTLLHQCGIGRDLLDCVFDANPLKIGKFLPGSGIPIVDKAQLEERQPDYCVILSGNFADAIREQHPTYLGKWVDPLPFPQVVGQEMAA
jgi:SAM-dependent methyltransferase